MRIGPSLHIGSGQAHRAVVRCTDWAALAFPRLHFPHHRYRIIFIEGAEFCKGSPLDPSHSALPLSSSQGIERERGTDAVAGRKRSGHRNGHLSFGSTPRPDFDATFP
jgi:hypothetical protein